MADKQKKCRLVTRGDLDGMVSAVLLRYLGMVDNIRFVHPKDVQDGRVKILANDITSNMPCVESVHLAFGHHAFVIPVVGERGANWIVDPEAPSSSRVIYEHYGGKERFPKFWDEMLAAVDKADTAQFTIQDVLYPQGWVLLNFLTDPRTGLEGSCDFRFSYNELMTNLIRHCGNRPIDEMFALPEIRERLQLYFEREMKFKKQLQRCTKTQGNIALLELRHEDEVYAGNRFMIYALHPDCNISIRVSDDPEQDRTVFAVGKSIFNRTSEVNIGELMSKYNGGGHENAGACRVGKDKADDVLWDLLRTCQHSS